MEHALAVVDATESARELVREAGTLAAGVDADLTLVHVTTEADYQDRADAMASIPNVDSSYTLGQALDGARQFAADVGRDVLADVDVEYDAVGRLGDADDEVLAVANDRDADHVFVAGRQRSPTGKALFGDTTQRIVLDFDGAVTVLTA